MEYNIASVLKQLRKTSQQTASDVIEKLKEHKINISVKTLYGYESGLSMPNANVFVALCQIYKCDNPMDVFGNSGIEPNELNLLEKYRSLDSFGKETIAYILDREALRVSAIQEKEKLSYEQNSSEK